MKLTFNNLPTQFKCDPALFSTMKYSNNYIQQLYEQIIDYKNTIEYEILNNDNIKSDSQNSNKNNNSLSDSCSDMDVDNAKELKISRQEQIDMNTFYYYFDNGKNIIMLLKYTKQGNFHGLKEKPGLSLIISRYSEN